MEYVKYDNTDITSDIKQPNENILFNSDFRYGVINQKGKTSYNSISRLYGADGWYVFTNSTLTVYGNYIKIILPNTLSEVGQLTDEWVNRLDKITFSIKFLNDETVYTTTFENVASLIPNSVNRISKIIYGNISVNLFNYGGKLSVFLTSSPSSSTVEIEYMKLEKGSYFTGMPVYCESEELNKCLRKQFSLGVGWGNQYPARSDNINHTVFIALPFIPRKAPALISIDDSTTKLITFTGNNVTPFNLSFDSYGRTAVSGSGIVIYYPVGSTPQIGFGQAVFNSNIILDFNDY